MPNHETEVVHTGFHSIIRQGQLPSGEIYLSKHYGEKAERGFDVRFAFEMVNLMKRFTQITENLDIPIAQPHGYYISNNHFPGLANVVEVVPFKGTNLLDLCRDKNIPDRELVNPINQYLDLFQKSWSSGFQISLDPPLANFSLDGNRKLWYIDCMPPRQIREDGTLLSEWPVPPAAFRPFIEKRYFSPLQSRVIYAQLLRGVSGRSFTPDDLKNIIGSRLGDRARGLINVPEAQVKNILDNPDITDVDNLRIISGEKFEQGLIGEAKLKEIYHLTHITNGGILPPLSDVQSAASLLKYQNN
jgi:hypothetical protein